MNRRLIVCLLAFGACGLLVVDGKCCGQGELDP